MGSREGRIQKEREKVHGWGTRERETQQGQKTKELRDRRYGKRVRKRERIKRDGKEGVRHKHTRGRRPTTN